MDEAFLDEDCPLKDSDGLEDLDIADEAALLELTDDEELDEGVELQSDEIQFVDEEGNPVEMGEGDLELYDIGEYNNQYPTTTIEVEPDEDVLEVNVDGEFDSLSQENADASLDANEGKRTSEVVKVAVNNVQKTPTQIKSKTAKNEESISRDASEGIQEQVKTVEGTQPENEGKAPEYSNQVDEESEEENPDDDDRHERFRSERANVVNISSAKKRSDIPDTLDSVIPVEEAAKVSEFLAREQERKNRFRKPRPRFKGGRGASNQGTGLLGKQPMILPMRGQIPVQPVHPTLQSPPFSYNNTPRLSSPAQRSSFNSHPPSRKILINPHFRGPRPSSVSEEPVSVMMSRPSQLLPNPHPSHMYGGRNLTNQTSQTLLPPPMQNMGPRLPPPQQQGIFQPQMDHPPPMYHGEHQLPHSRPPMSNAWNPITSQPNLSQPPMPLTAPPPRPSLFDPSYRGTMLQSSVPNTTFRENTVAAAVPQMIQMPNFQTPPPPTNPPVSLPPTHIPPPNHQPPFPPSQMPMKANIHLPQQQFRSPPDYIPSLMSLPLQPSSYPRNVQKDIPLPSQYTINTPIQCTNQQQPHNIQNRMTTSHIQQSPSQRRYKAHMQRKRLNTDDKKTIMAKQQRLDNRKQWKGVNASRKQAVQNSNIKEVPIVETIPVATIAKSQIPAIEEDEETKELRRKIEEQKKLREQILRRKEERRRMMAIERQKELQQRLNEQKQQQQQQQQQQHITINKSIAPDPRGKIKLSLKQRIGVCPQMQKLQITGTKPKKILVVRKKPQQQSTAPSQNNSTIVNLKAGQQRGNTVVVKKPTNVQHVVLQKRTVASPAMKTQQATVKNTQNLGEQRTVIARGCAVQQAQRHVIQIKTNDDVAQFNRKVLSPSTTKNITRTQRKINLVNNSGKVDTSVQQHNITRTQTVLVENLTASTNEAQLSHLCSSVGPVESIQLQRKERKAIIKFKEPLHAYNFQKKYQRHMLDLSLIQVSLVAT